MQIPETPIRVADLDLMKRLLAYAEGSATWRTDRAQVGEAARKACLTLHTGLMNMVEKALAHLLDRISAREMETFTMHDRMHGNKVAHLMWHILTPERQNQLSPPEIGLLVSSAFLHDAGMALSPSEREARLAPDSDLWERLEIDDTQRNSIEEIRARISDAELGDSARLRTERQLFQAQEALLAQDTRERHALPERYHELLRELVAMSESDPERIPNPRSAFSFDGDSFQQKLIQICVSHNQDAEALVERDPENFELPRFPRDYPVGPCTADLHLVAAILRLADILDFDRERTPPVMFHYLLPGPLTATVENRAILEWGKHLTISNWHIEKEAILFRGRSKSHVIHHAVVQFAGEIEREIEATRATFGALGDPSWPLLLPNSVQVQIATEGYRYVPYRFELDDERVYHLLMGGAIYDNPLVALRELIQNAVDSCKLKDAIMLLHQPDVNPNCNDRIIISYEEKTEAVPFPRLSVADTGTGMDGWLLERFFLKVGRSYYRSPEFNRTRFELRRNKLDFAPVSEFGIGFLSCFLLADQVQVESAMWEPVRGDTRKRTLIMDGPTRLIRLNEHENSGLSRLRGTRIILNLRRGNQKEPMSPASWEDVKNYIERICQDLPYTITLRHNTGSEVEEFHISARGTEIEIPNIPHRYTKIINVQDSDMGFEGTVLLMAPITLMPYADPSLTKDITPKSQPVITMFRSPQLSSSVLLRGGFYVGEVPGFERLFYGGGFMASARIRMTWESRKDRRFASTNLARTGSYDKKPLGRGISRAIVQELVENATEDDQRLLLGLEFAPANWLDLFDGLRMYNAARGAWKLYLEGSLGWNPESLDAWEFGSGESLPSVEDGIARAILSSALPLISNRQVDEDINERWTPPVANWRDILRNTTLTTQRGVDSFFSEYLGSISHLLAYTDAHGDANLAFNNRYRDHFRLFSDEKIISLWELVYRLLFLTASSVPVSMTSEQIEMLSDAIPLVGDLDVGIGDDRFRLADLQLSPPESVSIG